MQNEFEKLPEASKPKDELEMGFAELFQNANLKKKFSLLSVGNHFGIPDALFSSNATSEEVIEFFVDYITKNGISKKIRLDLGTVFKSRQCCTENVRKNDRKNDLNS